MTVAMLNMARKTPARAATRGAGVSRVGESMQQTQHSVNEHFQAAMRMAHHLPHLLTKQVKRAQQKAILRELLSGLKGGK